MIRIYRTVEAAPVPRTEETGRFEPGSWVSMINPTAGEIEEVAAKLAIPGDYLRAALDEEGFFGNRDPKEVLAASTGPVNVNLAPRRDLLRVPGSRGSLAEARAAGGELRGPGGDHRRLNEAALFSSFFEQVAGTPLSGEQNKVFMETLENFYRKERGEGHEAG